MNLPMDWPTPVGSTMHDAASEIVQLPGTKDDKNSHQTGVIAAQTGTERATDPAQRRGARSEARRTAELVESLPKGIRVGQWGDTRTKQFYVRYGADRKVESFSDEQDRNDFAEKLAQQRSEHGASALTVDLTEWRRWQDFQRRCPAPLHELEALWLKHSKRDRKTVNQAIERYIELRVREMGTGGVDAHRHMRLHLKRLQEVLGQVRLDSVNADALRDLLHGLQNPKTGAPMAMVTKYDHLKNWNTFFERAVLEEWIDKNPCALVILPAVDVIDKIALKPKEIFMLLKANRDQPVITRIVFELFGGLRASSAARLKPEHVKRSVKGIRLPGSVVNEETQQAELNHKGHKTVFRQGHPEVLWTWYDHLPAEVWTTVKKGSYDERKREAFIRAGVENPGNILRDSFASYLFALTNNLPLVSSLMQHTNTKTTLIYVGVAEEADARLVMAMTPKAVLLPWENFLKKASKR